MKRLSDWVIILCIAFFAFVAGRALAVYDKRPLEAELIEKEKLIFAQQGEINSLKAANRALGEVLRCREIEKHLGLIEKERRD